MMPVKMKAAKNVGAVILVASMGIATLINPVMGLLSALGLGLSCVVRWNSSSVPTTKRRSLTNLWHSLGAYGLAVAVLSSIFIGLGLLLFHSFFTWPIALFTLIACWLPFVLYVSKGKDRY